MNLLQLDEVASSRIADCDAAKFQWHLRGVEEKCGSFELETFGDALA